MKSLTVCMVTVSCFFVFTGIASGASVSNKLHIQAIVPPMLEFRTVHEKHELKITKSDVQKGYKEVNNGTSVSVTTNSSNGYVISISAQPLVSAENKDKDEKNKNHKKDKGDNDRTLAVYTYVTVTIDGRYFGTAPGGSVDFQMPATSKTNNTTRLSYRFALSPNVEADTYPWPIVVTVYPL